LDYTDLYRSPDRKNKHAVKERRTRGGGKKKKKKDNQKENNQQKKKKDFFPTQLITKGKKIEPSPLSPFWGGGTCEGSAAQHRSREDQEYR